jgi:amino acid adenylation domain-containing protein
MSALLLSPEKRRLAQNLLQQRGLTPKYRPAIPTRTSTGPAPLSFAQQRLWYHEQLHPGSALYNTPIVLELHGELNIEALADAFGQIIERHEVLRTVFRLVGSEPCQVVQPACAMSLPVENLTQLPEGERQQAALASAEASIRTPINLSEGPVFHARLIQLDGNRWWLLMMVHHMVFDGLSSTLLIRDLAASYATIIGKGSPLPPLALQYADFAQWQRSMEMDQKLEEQLNWWKQRLQNAPTLLALPTDRPRPAVQSFRGKSCELLIDAGRCIEINALARGLGVTTFAVLAAAFKLLLYRLTGQSDLVISTGVATRQYKEIENLLGCFINVLLLRTDLAAPLTCAELVQRVGETALSAFARQDLPFDRLVTALAPERDLSYNPLTQVMIVHHNAGDDLPEIHGVQARRVMLEKLIAQYDLLLHLSPLGESLYGRIEYSADLFDESTAKRLCEQYIHILGELVTRPQVQIDDVSLLPQHQVEAILGLNAAPTTFPRERCIHHLIEERVCTQPEAVAIATADVAISYDTLNRRANQLAGRLRELGVGRGAAVGVSLERSPALVVALLAVVKCGAAYVPIDPNYPQERVRFILDDSQPKLVVTHSALLKNFAERAKVDLCCLDREEDALNGRADNNVDANCSPDDLLYLIYTSGSTGAPKGAMLDHRGRVNNFHDFNTRFGIGPGDRLLAVSSISFDMCAYDVFGTLMCGGTIVLPPGSASPAPDAWGELILRHQVTVWHSAPALLGALLERFDQGLAPSTPSLRLALLGGDWIPLTMPDALRRYAGPQITVVSLGGATEVSMDSTIYVVGQRDPQWSSIPYGVAMANQTAFVLDDRMRIVPVGVAGELYLGGVGVGWGYFRRPGLTATRFVPNPYAREPGERIYRTGDIARWTNSGMLELLGRADFQVKINGVRIELGEIDAALAALEGVRACVTSLHRPSDGPPQLVSYVVPEGESFDWERSRSKLFERLPSYMVPRQHVVLERLPLSPNGKVLRTALPAPAAAILGDIELTEPRTVMERTLHTLWGSALGMEDFGIDHDFFDLGGTSMQAAMIVNRVPRRLSLLEFMQHSTIRGQAALLAGEYRPAESRIFRFPTNRPSRLTLLCVPYAGGSAIVFRGLAKSLPADIATAVVCMPAPADCEADELTLKAVAEQCLQELSPQELKSLALYGHCAGTALAAELARQLRDRGKTIRGLFLAAAMPPGVPTPFTMPRETEQEIIDFVAALGGTEESANAEDWQVMVREFQRDSRMVRDHVRRHFSDVAQPLDAPLVVLIGDVDPLTEGHQDHASIWEKVSRQVAIHKVSGGHYFVSTAPIEVARIVASQLGEQQNIHGIPKTSVALELAEKEDPFGC